MDKENCEIITTCIYKITSPSGKIYIGQTNNLKRRQREYKYMKCKKQVKLYNSFQFHGYSNHVYSILFEGICNNAILDELEIEFISIFNSFKSGLNMSTGGAGRRGFKMNENQRLGLAAVRHRKASDITKQRMSDTRTGVKRSKQTCENISKAKAGVPKSDAHKKSMSISRKGKSIRRRRCSRPDTGVVYDSIKELAEAMNINYSALRSRLRKTNNLPLIYKRAS